MKYKTPSLISIEEISRGCSGGNCCNGKPGQELEQR